MEKRQIVGLAGSIVLVIGVFTPLVSMPFSGSLTYFNNGRGDGVIVLMLALISALFILLKRYRLLWLTGIGSLGLTVYTFFSILTGLSSLQQELADNPFAGLMTGIQLQWGWGILILGNLMLLTAAAMRSSANRITPDLHENQTT